MDKLIEMINNKRYIFDIVLNDESSKTVIKYTPQQPNYETIRKTLDAIMVFIKRHKLFNKPIIKLCVPDEISPKILDELASEMSNEMRNSFSKLQIVSINRKFEYDGWDWVEHVLQKPL